MYVYEKGSRIGADLEESAIRIARKLNAYESRIRRLKSVNRKLRKAGDELADALWPQVPQGIYDVLKWEDAKKR